MTEVAARRLPKVCLLAVLLCANVAHAEPYRRIVTLAPHLAELVFAVDAGERLVGVSAWSDYPEAVTALPLVGDAFTVDHEQLKLLQPDVLLAWESGMPAATRQKLAAMGYNVEVIRTQSLADIAAAMRRIGELTGNTAVAEQLARQFEAELDSLAATRRPAARRDVFIQIGDRPLYTVNGDHYISEAVALCGGRNVFADLAQLAPSVDVEAVVAAQPAVILATNDAGLERWQRWPVVPAVSRGHLYALPPDETGRPTARVLVAVREICRILDRVQNEDRTEP